MKKHFIAAAVAAAVAVPAVAQVSVYGVIDKGIRDIDSANYNGTAATVGLASGASNGQLSSERIGFRGSEDLGGGLKAHFVAEAAIGSTAFNLGTDNARTLIVGLSGGFGTINLGRDKTPSQLFAEAYTAGAANNMVGEGLLYKGLESASTHSSSTVAGANLLSEADLERANGVTYISPNFNGVTARVMFASNDVETSRTSSGTIAGRDELSVTDISVRYSAGGLDVGLALGSTEEESGAAAATNTENDLKQFGASYSIGPAKVFLQYADTTSKGTNGATDRTQEVTQAGIQLKTGANLMVYGQLSDGEVTSGTAKTFDTKSYQVGALYSLSKRTTAYVIMGEQKNTNTSNVTLKDDGFAVGVRHTF
ncbi:OmpC Outer membrane protein (porin) [Burkholderiales bacterium]